jgi:hypothetical protein
MAPRQTLRGIGEIRSFFRTNVTPIYFVGATAFNLLGLDRWVREFHYITYYDSWDGAHPRIFTPRNRPYTEFAGAEEINNYLLRDPEVQAFIAGRAGQPKIAMVFFNEETEQICEELGYELILPSNALRTRLDSKITTTRLGDEAGAPSVPNVLGSAGSYAELIALAAGAGLGQDLVVQLAYGDSGKTTFFIATEADYDGCAAELSGEELKVMKRINHRAVAVEAVITSRGTVVGPFMNDLTGYPELTPYQGGWCGNDIYPAALSDQHRVKAIDLIQRLGGRLDAEGYRGFFEMDVLVDLDSDEVYLGELNPRISGASSITNVTAGAYADIPLFLFHVLEYLDVDAIFDVEEINKRWLDLAAVDVWSQLVIKETVDSVECIERAPRTGQWVLDDDGGLRFQRAALDWHQLQNPNEFFFLRVYGAGDYRFKGADLGIVVSKSRMQTDEPKALTERCHRLIESIRGQYTSTPVESPSQAALISPLKSSAYDVPHL